MSVVDEDDSGLTFEEWDPSSDTDTSEAPVTMIVNSSALCDPGFDLREVIPLNSRRWHVEDTVRVVRSSSRFTVWVPGGMYSPWITTTSSGHDVSEYELGVLGLPRAYVSPQQPCKNWLKIEKNHDFCKKKKVWYDDPPEDRLISIFTGCLANHDRAHSLMYRLGMHDVPPSVWGVLTSSNFSCLSFITPTLSQTGD